jgi:hypothetical protein
MSAADTLTDDDLESLFGATKPSESQLKDVSALAEKAVEIQKFIEEGEEAIKNSKRQLRGLTEGLLPDALASLGVEEFKLSNGSRIVMKSILEGSLPKEEEARDNAVKWLAENGAADLIKSKIEIAVEKGNTNLSAMIAGYLNENEIDFEQKDDVHHGSLKAFVREKMANGEDVPIAALGLYAARAAEVKLPPRPKTTNARLKNGKVRDNA